MSKSLESKLKQIRKDTNSDEIGVNISVDKKRIRIRSIDFRYDEDDEDNDKENIKKLQLNGQTSYRIYP